MKVVTRGLKPSQWDWITKGCRKIAFIRTASGIKKESYTTCLRL